MKKAKCDDIESAEKEALEHSIKTLEFYSQNYIRSSMQTISYAVPLLVNEVRGSSAKLCQALHILEQVAITAENRIAKLRSKLGKRLPDNPVNPVNPVQ